jgi:cytochrome c oxidase assembly protein subunit 15
MDDVKRTDDVLVIRVWLGCVLGMILLMVAVGGITRLTDSGLSMVTWEPILGAWPPVSAADWQHRFDQYRQFPEYQQLRKGMSLEEFKVIFFWEYLHRLLGRLLGLVYAVPLAWFWWRGRIPRWLKLPLLAGLVLGGMQGVMGWYMVKSGLVDDPYVSHYRLAAHLGLAFIVFSYLLWLLLRTWPPSLRAAPASGAARTWAYLLVAMVVVQIVWGAFVAGLNAGFMYNTFPKMQGYWIPPFWNQLEPLWRNAVDNPIAVQWIHRALGTSLLVLVLVAWAVLRRDPTVSGDKRGALALFVMLLIGQFWLGVFTLVWMVPLALGVMHQVMACLICGASVYLLHTFRGMGHA